MAKKHKKKNKHTHTYQQHASTQQQQNAVSKQPSETVASGKTLDAQIIEMEIESTTAQIANLSPDTPHPSDRGPINWKMFLIGLVIGAILTVLFI